MKDRKLPLVLHLFWAASFCAGQPYDNSVVVQIFAGSGLAKTVDGVGAEASFAGPQSVAVDSQERVTVLQANGIFRRIDPDGTVETAFKDSNLRPTGVITF